MLASTLMFKVLSGAASDKMRYEMLYKIGTRRKVLKQSIRHEIGVLFLLPGILGVIDVLFGLRLFTALLPHPYMGFWVPFSIFIVLYFIYYAVTVKLYENLVLQKYIKIKKAVFQLEICFLFGYKCILFQLGILISPLALIVIMVIEAFLGPGTRGMLSP